MKLPRSKQEVFAILREFKDAGFILSEYSGIVQRVKKKYEFNESIFGVSNHPLPFGKITPDMIENEGIMTLVGILSDQVNWLYDRIKTMDDKND